MLILASAQFLRLSLNEGSEFFKKMKSPALDTNNPMLHLQRAAALFQQEEWAQSGKLCESLLSAGHCNFDTLHLFGLNLFRLGKLKEARQILEQAIQLNPQHAQVYNSLGSVCLSMSVLDKAEKNYCTAIELQPQGWEAHQNLINLYLNSHKLDKAQHAIDYASNIFGSAIQLLRLKARFYQGNNNTEKTLEILDQIIEQYPGDWASINDRGVSYQQNGQLSAAITCFEKAIELNPNFVNAQVNLAHCYSQKGLFDRAELMFKQALESLTQKGDADSNIQFGDEEEGLIARIHFQLSNIALLRGDYRNGWQHYVNRPSMLLRKKSTVPELPADLRGKRILLLRDQGLGDEIFFLRFCQKVKERGAYVHYLVSPEIEVLLNNHPDIDELSTTLPDGEFDFTLAIADLPLALGIFDATGIPEPITLTADETISENLFTQHFSDLPKPLFGISWRAGAEEKSIYQDVQLLEKKLPLEQLINILKGFRGTLVILQRNPTKGEIEFLRSSLPCEIIDLSAYNSDLKNMTAILSLLDEYIGVSNTNMHIRGSLGLTAKLLIPFPPEWRWQVSGETSVWYKQFNLFRQGNDYSWDSAIAATQKQLGLISQ